MWWLGLFIVYGILLYKFGKTTLKYTGILLGIGVLAVSIFFLVIGIQDSNYDKRKKSVEMSVEYKGAGCEKAEFPLAIAIHNGSKKIIEEVSFDIEVRREGYSSDLVKGYSNYKSDKIIQPGESYKSCWSMPDIDNNGISYEDLVYEIGYKYTDFAD